jgi:putative transcriptional regulator
MTYDHISGFIPCTRVLEIRETLGWSRSELATKLNVSQQIIYAIETGRYDPTKSLARKIADVFNLPIEQVFES